MLNGSVTPCSGCRSPWTGLRDPLVIERRLSLLGVGVDDDELLAALHRLAIPEPMRLADRRRRAGDVDGGSLVSLAQPVARA